MNMKFQLFYWENDMKENNEAVIKYNEQVPIMDKENMADREETKETVNIKNVEEITKLNENLRKAAEGTLKQRDEVKREFIKSEATEQLFKDRQQLKEEGKFDEAKKLTNKIKKSINKDREAFYTKNFEEEIWQDI